MRGFLGERGHKGRGGFGGRMAAMMGAGPFGGRGEDDFGRDGFGGPFGGRGRGGGHGGGHHGGRRGKRFDGEELRLMVLALLRDEAPQHGYQLIRAFAARSGDAYQPSPGVLYPMLTLLADMGLLAEVAGEGASSRRSYQLTEAGEAEVSAQAERIAALFARLAALAEANGKVDAAPVRRAFHNLRAASIERLTREGASPDTIFEVARILDEAAQKIERL
ncbi:PadR family transcriptional regulator [Novosphingobium sp. FSY-8]|uniref:PadR family transcriptional regulator n=1 Tax=Novosphingobium ovatum TaxID=1908523 RepID=A0ABW9X9J0_9SPHN|nr:PadR family transcriptional regulator [Novosphingobium ovatum]NBC35196.1 PadR family transcriptional regulator [Novosphingobium ovatum]